jgi:hypothetical protein
LIYPYGGQEKLRGGGLISFFLNGLFLGGKYMCIVIMMMEMIRMI